MADDIKHLNLDGLNTIKIPEYTEEQLQEILEKSDPAELRLVFLITPETTVSELTEIIFLDDKYGDAPYTEHLKNVAQGVSSSQKDLALLHDVQEDHPATMHLVEMVISKELRQQIDIISRKPQESYFDYIKRIKISNDSDVIAVKLSDLSSNLTHKPSPSLAKRYKKAIAILKA